MDRSNIWRAFIGIWLLVAVFDYFHQRKVNPDREEGAQFIVAMLWPVVSVSILAVAVVYKLTGKLPAFVKAKLKPPSL